jgi:protein-S-isoprenylcysteine O-methyltransferase Ste14
LLAQESHLAVHLFVVFYEEPTLHGKFGSEYDEYRRNVRRLVAAAARLDQPR